MKKILAALAKYTEIVFWYAAVFVMRHARNGRIVWISVAVIVLALSFPVRVAVGHLAGRVEAAQEAQTSWTAKGTRQASQAQRNLLLIVSKAGDQGQAELSSIWLMAFLPGSSSITLLPIYPAVTTNGKKGDHILESAFHLDADGKPVSPFFNALRTLDLRWDASVILDEAALNELAALARQSDPKNANAEAGSQMDQMAAACLYIGAGRHEGVVKKLERSVTTSFEAESDWEAFRRLVTGGKPFTCEFPTLAGVDQGK